MPNDRILKPHMLGLRVLIAYDGQWLKACHPFINHLTHHIMHEIQMTIISLTLIITGAIVLGIISGVIA